MDASATSRRLGLGEIIVTTLRIYRDNYLTFFVILAIYMLPEAALSAISLMLPNLEWLNYLQSLLGVLGMMLCSAAATYAAGQVYLGKTVNVGAAYRKVLDRFGSLLNAGIRVGIVLLPSLTVIGIPVTIYFLVRWSLWMCAVMLDGDRARPSLARSSDLVKGSWWRVFGITLVLGSVPFLAPYTVNVVLVILGQAPDLWSAITSTNPGEIAVDALAQMFIAAFTTIGQVILYFDLRLRKEGPGGKQTASPALAAMS